MIPIRPYVAVFEGVTVSAAQDLFEFTVGAGVVAVVLEVHISQDSAETSEQLPVQLRFVPDTVTPGSGGSSVTPRNIRRGDSAASSTLTRNNTAQASSSGTIETLRRAGENVLNGWHWIFTPETGIWLPPSGVFVVSLPTAPAAGIPFSGEFVFGELP